jgi:hypothetical protein
VCKEVELGEEVELWALSSFVYPPVVVVVQLVGGGVVWQEPVLGSASVIPLSEEGEMVEEP